MLSSRKSDYCNFLLAQKLPVSDQQLQLAEPQVYFWVVEQGGRDKGEERASPFRLRLVVDCGAADKPRGLMNSCSL
jgi:hypothetical protein